MKWIADALGKEGIYDGHIALNEYPYLDIKQDLTEQKIQVQSVMNPKSGSLVTLPLQDRSIYFIRNLRIFFYLIDIRRKFEL